MNDAMSVVVHKGNRKMSETFGTQARSRLRADAYASIEFAFWLMERPEPNMGEHCLGLACGGGMQAFPPLTDSAGREG